MFVYACFMIYIYWAMDGVVVLYLIPSTQDDRSSFANAPPNGPDSYREEVA